MEFVITFQSSHQAIKAERKFLKIFRTDLIPTPREISSECGFSLKISQTELGEVKNLLEKENLKYAGIYTIINSVGEKQYEKNN